MLPELPVSSKNDPSSPCLCNENGNEDHDGSFRCRPPAWWCEDELIKNHTVPVGWRFPTIII